MVITSKMVNSELPFKCKVLIEIYSGSVLYFTTLHHQVLVSLSQQMHFYSQVSCVGVSVSEVHYNVVHYIECTT